MGCNLPNTRSGPQLLYSGWVPPRIPSPLSPGDPMLCLVAEHCHPRLNAVSGKGRAILYLPLLLAAERCTRRAATVHGLPSSFRWPTAGREAEH